MVSGKEAYLARLLQIYFSKNCVFQGLQVILKMAVLHMFSWYKDSSWERRVPIFPLPYSCSSVTGEGIQKTLFFNSTWLLLLLGAIVVLCFCFWEFKFLEILKLFLFFFLAKSIQSASCFRYLVTLFIVHNHYCVPWTEVSSIPTMYVSMNVFICLPFYLNC